MKAIKYLQSNASGLSVDYLDGRHFHVLTLGSVLNSPGEGEREMGHQQLLQLLQKHTLEPVVLERKEKDSC